MISESESESEIPVGQHIGQSTTATSGTMIVI